MNVPEASNDLLYNSRNESEDDKGSSGIKVEKLYELLSALDEVALQSHNGTDFYPAWILEDVKQLHELLRRCYDQVCRGIQIDVTREELEERVERVRGSLHGQTPPNPSTSPRRNRASAAAFCPLVKHKRGSQYCLDTFRTVKHHGELFHVPGRPNPDVYKLGGRRKYLKETVRALSKDKPRRRTGTKSTSSRRKSSRLVRELLDRAEMIEKRLLGEARREIQSEQMLERMRAGDNQQFMNMLARLDALIEALNTRPAPEPHPQTTKVVVDNAKVDALQNELNNEREEHERIRKHLQERVEQLASEVKKVRQDLIAQKECNVRLEDDLSRLRSLDGQKGHLRSQLEESIERLEESVKKYRRNEKRLHERIEELEMEVAEGNRLSSSQRKEIERLTAMEEDLKQRIHDLRRQQTTGNAGAAQERLHAVVSRVMLRTFISRFRKQRNVRDELQRTVDSLSDALKRQQRMHQTEIEATRDLMKSEALQLQEAIESKRKVTEELEERAKRLKEDLDQRESQHNQQLVLMKRDSIGEIEQLRLQLFQLRNSMKDLQEKPPEPVLDYGQFAKLMADSFRGDYLRLEDVPSVLHTMFEHGDDRVLFSDYVECLSPRNFKQKRLLIISPTTIYILLPKAHKLQRIFKLDAIDKVTMSRRAADVIVIHHRNEPDIFFYSEKRPEIVFHLMGASEAVTGKKLNFHFAERFYVEDENLHYRNIEVPESQVIKLGKSVLLGPS